MSFDAHLYRLLHRGNPGDVEFYRDVCADAASVLELGCGDGRIAVPLAAAGLRVTGLDDHPVMLAEARRRAAEAGVALHIVEGDMADFDLGARFDRVIIPYTALYCLDAPRRHAALCTIARHLTPRGRVALDVYPGDSLLEREAFEDDEAEWIDELYDPTQDAIVEVWESDRHDPVQRRMDVTYLHRICTPDGRAHVTEYTLTHHYLALAEIEPVFAAAGLWVRAMYGDFGGGPATANAERLVVIAEPAGDTTR